MKKLPLEYRLKEAQKEIEKILAKYQIGLVPSINFVDVAPKSPIITDAPAQL